MPVLRVECNAQVKFDFFVSDTKVNDDNNYAVVPVGKVEDY